jgi:hypothetical protein
MSIERQVLSPVDIRKEGRRRLIIGFAGLAAMMLLVLLSSWLTSAARQEAEIAKQQAQAAGVTTADGTQTGPLSDLGAAPSSSAAPTPVPHAQEATTGRNSGGTIVVPDLEPDPHLEASDRAR